MNDTKKKIKLLNEECKQIPQERCHSNCPYEKICLVIRCVGVGSKYGSPRTGHVGYENTGRIKR